ncbi:hypothetical protein GQ600_7490 [Phytophthora cactorum]|nr:hypothetical protein GQ600_7490 [Phytophthora cactorum]
MTAAGHQRELMAAESPGPKYNVNYLASNGGKAAPPKYSFAAPPSPKSQLVLKLTGRACPTSIVLAEATASLGCLLSIATGTNSRHTARRHRMHTPNNNASGKNGGNVFGHEQRFGKRQIEPPKRHTPAAGNTRVQFVSATHTRENMGEFSPGPIYAPYNPERSGGRLAPSPSHAGVHSLQEAQPALRTRTPTPVAAARGSLVQSASATDRRLCYCPPSSFASFSHNAKARAKGIRSLTMTGATSARSLRPRQQPLSPRKGSATTRPAEPTWTDDEP